MPDSAPKRPSRISTIAIVLAAISAGLPALGIAAIHIGLAPPMVGFGMFAMGCVLGGLLTLLLGIAALIVARGGTDPQGQRQAIMAVVLALGLFAIVYVAGRPGAGLPGINDITTNLDDPPAYTTDPSGRDRDMSYPPAFVEQVRAAYSDLQTLSVELSPSDAFARASAAAEALGWEITNSDAGAGILEASDTTAIFQFVDDVVVRIRPGAGGAAVDVRSKSRDGGGDVGANAARIRAFFAELDV